MDIGHLDELKVLLDEKAEFYNQVRFIEKDPICIPHQYHQKEDIEIAGFWTAVLSWGQRKTIINKCHQLFDMMGHQPFRFIMDHEESDLIPFESFRHRTFNGTDTLYFINTLRRIYQTYGSLEAAFTAGMNSGDETVEEGIAHFHEIFFAESDHPQRTRKHVSTPVRKSACKRINMFLRWMVRKDDCGVDFGIWKDIKTSQLVCPCDVHVERVARQYGLISRKLVDWEAAMELTMHLRKFDPLDPIRYDFALFGMGQENNKLVN
jgi:uncharacterized protein (TIGR02757 family)